MIISDLESKQLDQFYECFSEIMREGYSDFPPKLQDYFLSVLYTKSNFFFWIEKSLRKILIAQEDSKIIGFLVGDQTYGGVGFVSWVGVTKSYRQQNIGSKLMVEYEKFVKIKKGHLLELFTYEKVKPFYLKHGFEQIGVREQGYFGQMNIIMNKRLGYWDEKVLEIIL